MFEICAPLFSWLICLPAILVGFVSGVKAAYSPRIDNRLATTGLLLNFALIVLVIAFIVYAANNF
jgi:hypothetical protein